MKIFEILIKIYQIHWNKATKYIIPSKQCCNHWRVSVAGGLCSFYQYEDSKKTQQSVKLINIIQCMIKTDESFCNREVLKRLQPQNDPSKQIDGDTYSQGCQKLKLCNTVKNFFFKNTTVLLFTASDCCELTSFPEKLD